MRYANNDIDRSLTDVNEAVQLDPRGASAWIMRVHVWHVKDRLDLALADVNEAIRLEPKNACAYLERGVFHFGVEAYD